MNGGNIVTFESNSNDSGSTPDSDSDGSESATGLKMGSRTIITPFTSITHIKDSGISSLNLSSGDASAIVEINTSMRSASLNATSDTDYDLTFAGGTQIDQWSATLSSGNDQIFVDDVMGGIFDGGSGNDLFSISSALNGDITLTGSNDFNVFHAQASTVSSSRDQNKSLSPISISMMAILSSLTQESRI